MSMDNREVACRMFDVETLTIRKSSPTKFVPYASSSDIVPNRIIDEADSVAIRI